MNTHFQATMERSSRLFASADKGLLGDEALALTPLASALDVPLTVHRMPATTSRQERISVAIMLSLIAGCTNSVDSSDNRWLNFIIFYIDLLYPQLTGSLKGVTLRDMSGDEVNASVAAFRGAPVTWFSPAASQSGVLTDYSPDDNVRKTTMIGAIAELTRIVGLPSCNIDVGRLAKITNHLGAGEAQGHLSILVYLAGKHYHPAGMATARQGGTTTTSNLQTYHVARPKAIQDKFFDGESLVTLSGDWRMVEHSIERISAVWAKNTSIRSQVIGQFASLKSGLAGASADIFYLTFSLLEYADMHSYLIIRGFLEAYPFAMAMPSLAGEVAYFLAGVEQLSNLPALKRPLYKVMMGDKFKIFKRDDLPKLLGLAVQVMSISSPNLGGFESTPPPTDISAEFNTRLAAATGR
jgi:hypothetical protein